MVVLKTKTANATEQLSEHGNKNASKDASEAATKYTPTITPVILARMIEIDETETVEAKTTTKIKKNSTETATRTAAEIASDIRGVMVVGTKTANAMEQLSANAKMIAGKDDSEAAIE